MRQPAASTRRRWPVVPALLVGTMSMTGCGSAPVAPLPAQWPTPTPAGSASASPTSTAELPRPAASTPAVVAATPPPTRTRTPPRATPTVELSPACLPAVIFTVDGSDSAALPRALCLTVAAILRVQNVGPGTVAATPTEKVAQHYEGGVVDCRMLRPGTVEVEIAFETGGSHTITVLVVE
ncbi:hypothetical protein O7626_09560 [Micromonospora sp. WMMD1102]|uniref:hypothetical protein n=1 Tax=Micromonospora sp. WMMD1102 TaxID=3016105 RepID=UPI002414E609|nr:hypothetical protein [Micromonospora sp. WMMD1102]MDG4786171.1 hypothetical protein [Micromonospora sp. WMMD1102]